MILRDAVTTTPNGYAVSSPPNQRECPERGSGAKITLTPFLFPVVSQRDYLTLDRIMRRLNPDHESSSGLKDHHEIDWHRDYFGAPSEA